MIVMVYSQNSVPPNISAGSVNGLDWQCCLAGSSKTAPRILIFSIVLGTEYLSDMKSIETHAHVFLTLNILSIGTVNWHYYTYLHNTRVEPSQPMEYKDSFHFHLDQLQPLKGPQHTPNAGWPLQQKEVFELWHLLCPLERRSPAKFWCFLCIQLNSIKKMYQNTKFFSNSAPKFDLHVIF